MIKGCTKRVIVVKDVQSDVFEEAYFILRPQSEDKRRNASESDFIAEANKIVTSRDCSGSAGSISYAIGGKSRRSARLHDFICFLCGCAFAAAGYAIYYVF